MTTKLIPLLNPLSHTFSYDWKDDENVVHKLVMEPVQITYFTSPQAEFMVKHLTDAVMAARKLNGINHIAEIEEIKKEIRVTI